MNSSARSSSNNAEQRRKLDPVYEEEEFQQYRDPNGGRVNNNNKYEQPAYVEKEKNRRREEAPYQGQPITYQEPGNKAPGGGNYIYTEDQGERRENTRAPMKNSDPQPKNGSRPNADLSQRLAPPSIQVNGGRDEVRTNSRTHSNIIINEEEDDDFDDESFIHDVKEKIKKLSAKMEPPANYSDRNVPVEKKSGNKMLKPPQQQYIKSK